MKKFTISLILMLLGFLSFAQDYPTAVNDTVPGIVITGDIITINVINNDTDPQGDAIKIVDVQDLPYIISNTDSTITFRVNMELGNDSSYFQFYYKIEDIYGNSQPFYSKGYVYYFYVVTGYDFLDVNNIDARFNAFGAHFWDFDDNHYYFPKGSNTQSMFTSTFWLGGIDETNNLHLAAERYRQIGSDYQTGPLSFNEDSCWITQDISDQYLKVWKLNKSEVEYHILHYNDPGYEAIENIATWPAHGDPELNQAEYLAPFIDSDNNGQYDPMQGDYPLIRGDQSLFFIFNDQNIHTETAGLPFGVEIHGFAYAFNEPDEPWLNNTTFLSYKIFNRSQNTYEDCYAGIWSDIDLGYAVDDYVGCDVARGAYYAYNGVPVDGNGEPESYGAYPPAQGVIILGGPYMDPDGEDNPAGGCDESINGVGFGDGEPDNERYGMNNFIYFNNGGTAYANDPSTAVDYYNYLQGIWLDNTAMLYGGNGHVSSGAYGPDAKFMFPGTSDPCNWGTGGVLPNGAVDWTEVTAGNIPNDRRGLSSMGPFTLEPGGFHKVDMAFVSALGEDYLASIEVMQEYIDLIREDYFADPDHFGYAWLGTDELNVSNVNINIFPNPVSELANFYYEPQSNDAGLNLIDEYGRTVLYLKLSKGQLQQINLTNLEKGLYISQITDGDRILTLKFLKK